MNSGIIQLAGPILRNLEQTDHVVTNLRNDLCQLPEQAIASVDEVTEAPDAGRYFPFRGIVIGSLLGLGVWLLIWLLA